MRRSVCFCVCMGSYSVAALTGACLSLVVMLLIAETEMDSHAAVEGQGYSWLSPSPVHHADTEGQAHSLNEKTVLSDTDFCRADYLRVQLSLVSL